MMDTLKPVVASQYYLNRVTKGLCRYFWDNIFNEIFEILKGNAVFNSKDDVINALKAGRIWYENGAFRTNNTFSNAVAKTLEGMGAKYMHGAYYINYNLIPVEYFNTIALIQAQTAQKTDSILKFLLGLDASLSYIDLDEYIGAATEMLFRKVQLDIIESAKEKRLPLINLGIVVPKAKFPKTKEARSKKGKKGGKNTPKEDANNPPSEDTNNPPSSDTPLTEGTNNPPKEEGAELDLNATTGYSAEEIDKYWRAKENEAERLHKKWAKAAEKFNKTKSKPGVSAEEYNKASKAVEDASKELADFRVAEYQNAPQLEVTIDDVELDEKSREIAKDYVYNMKYWVKGWETKNIVKMRQDILKLRQEGARLERIAEYFEKRWHIAVNKAKFLAENESGLAVTALTVAEQKELGGSRFVWGKSTSIERRKLHKEYYGKTFSYDDPPIIDEKLGIRGLPRQIWNCKCVILPVVPTLDEALLHRKQVRNDKRNLFKKIINSAQRNNNPWRYRRFGERETF